MRIAILSDIHGNLHALEEVLEDARNRVPDLVVNLGDCVTGPLWPVETFELLESVGLPTVRGNHDRWLVEAPAGEPQPRSVRFTQQTLGDARCRVLHALPARLEMEDALLVHGTPAHDASYLMEDRVEGRLAPVTAGELARRIGDERATLVCCGHSHTQRAVVDARGRLVVNPGAVGCPRYADDGRPDEGEASSPHARYAIATRRHGRWEVELLALAYDWAAVAAQARRNGRADFAEAFLGVA